MFESVRRSFDAARRSNSLVAGAIRRLMASVLRSITMTCLCWHCLYIVGSIEIKVKGNASNARVLCQQEVA